MKKAALLIALIVFCALGAYLYLHRPEHEATAVKVPPPSRQPAATAHPQQKPEEVLEELPEHAALPVLAQSDGYMLDELSRVIGNGALLRLFIPGHLIHNIVATVDNLPRRDSTMNVMPVRQVPGKFLASGKGGEMII
ncbi:MAG TPA: hypothetical protein PLK99_12710, partial [Burkholderiales bacterium]|nr:hypothetical protein [Burkholderiales bacterium]